MESVLLKEALEAYDVLEDSEFRRPNLDGWLRVTCKYNLMLRSVEKGPFYRE